MKTLKIYNSIMPQYIPMCLPFYMSILFSLLMGFYPVSPLSAQFQCDPGNATAFIESSPVSIFGCSGMINIRYNGVDQVFGRDAGPTFFLDGAGYGFVGDATGGSTGNAGQWNYISSTQHSPTSFSDFLEIDVAGGIVNVEQHFDYTPGDDVVMITYHLTNNSTTTFNSTNLIYGMDTYINGDDNGDYGEEDWANTATVGLTDDTPSPLFQGMSGYLHLNDPNIAAMTYYTEFYSLVWGQIRTGSLPNTISPIKDDQGYAIGFEKAGSLAPGETWTVTPLTSFNFAIIVFNDFDGDGFTTQDGDCDDGDANTYPGAPEICDGMDNDCDGVIPADELDGDGDGIATCEGDCDDINAAISPAHTEIMNNGIDDDCNPATPDAVDIDGDGYTVTAGDCNDNDPAVHPGATEVCNGIDDDCNGTVDDGAAATYTGNIAFTSQAQVDAFLSCYTTINGSVTVQGAGIFDLSPLSNVQTITGNLTIQYAGLFNLAGLDNLHTVGGAVTIFYNYILSSLYGLENLSSVGASYWMYYNFLLSDCCAIDDLLTNGGVGGAVSIFFNASGSHCSSAAAIMAACPIAPLVGQPSNTSLSNGISVGEQEAKTLLLYPNPAQDEVSIRFGKVSSAAYLRITDMLGRVVFEKEMAGGTSGLDIGLTSGQFENGIYLVSIFENGQTSTKQMVVQR